MGTTAVLSRTGRKRRPDKMHMERVLPSSVNKVLIDCNRQRWKIKETVVLFVLILKVSDKTFNPS